MLRFRRHLGFPRHGGFGLVLRRELWAILAVWGMAWSVFSGSVQELWRFDGVERAVWLLWWFLSGMGCGFLAWQQGQRGNDLISVNGITVSVLVRLRHSLEKNFQILFDCC